MTTAGLAMLKSFEGFRRRPYRDSAGYWTVGWGHRLYGAIRWWYSKSMCEQFLAEDVALAQSIVAKYVAVALTGEQNDALVDFVFNLGATAFEDSTLLRVLNEGHYNAVPAQLMRWVHAGGQINEGLVKRRRAEAQAFS